MATNAFIGIVVKPQDRGRLIEPNIELLGKPYDTDIREPEFYVTEIEETTEVIRIYHHYDGYPEMLGETLVKEFNDYEKVMNLVAFGDASSINGESARFYNSWRGDSWEYTQPNQDSSVEEYMELELAYLYLFKDGKWYVKYSPSDSDWVELVKVLDNEAEV